MDLLIMAWEFFKTGLFAIGGGLATLPFLSVMAEKYPWFTKAQLLDMIAVSESTPGPIGVNMSTFAGFEAHGVMGGLVATCSLVLPSVVIIILVSKFMQHFAETPLVQNAFYGIRPSTMGLIAGAMYDVFMISFFYTDPSHSYWKITGVQWLPVVMFITILWSLRKWEKLHPIFYIAIGAVMGLVFKL